MSDTNFFICEHCKNIVYMVKNNGVAINCCGEKMKMINANTTDAAKEKHIPLCQIDKDILKVQVGSVNHPMSDEHYIEFICLQTENGVQIRYLKPNAEPMAQFNINDEKVIAVFAYCNLHGLWRLGF